MDYFKGDLYLYFTLLRNLNIVLNLDFIRKNVGICVISVREILCCVRRYVGLGGNVSVIDAVFFFEALVPQDYNANAGTAE